MHLGVSRNTAIASYDLLLSEGYLTSRPGAGTFVADMRPRPNPRKSRATRTPAATDAWPHSGAGRQRRLAHGQPRRRASISGSVFPTGRCFLFRSGGA